MGLLPSAEQAMTIAYLRAGKKGIEETLLATAVVTEWDGDLVGLRQRCEAAARAMLPRVKAEAAPFARAKGARSAAFVMMSATACLVLLVGWIRCVRAEMLARPHGFLIVLMLVSFVVSPFLAERAAAAPGVRTQRYLAWLRDALHALAFDPNSDVTLATAVFGVEAIHRLPAIIASGAFAAPVAPRREGTWFSSGSCSSGSSCSSGGSGCGG